MEKKRKIVQYRERLDKTLSSPDLTNEEALKALVERQLHSLGQEIEGYEHQEKAVETRAAEVSKFLDMLRSVSADGSGRSKTLQTDWKLKQDNEEFRVMYHEGPEGTPFHTLLAEGYVDGPVDVCLCMSWETPLYKKWWPQFTVPTFKILVSDCLQRARIGEQLSLVRVKLSWPLSTREAVMHYYLFEYFQDDLIVVIINTIPDSKSFDGLLYGFNNEAIPEAKDVVRIDVVGGFALQKVTSERSYFRTIANMDIKLDIVPPSLINFISRQLIGSGFRLYQKSVASMMDHDEAFIKALEEPLYSRLREALYVIDGSRKAMDAGELKQGVNILPAEDVTESKQDETKDVPWEDKGNYQADDSTSVNEVALDNGNAYGEIVEADGEETEHTEEDDGKVKYFPIKEDNMSQLKGKRNVHIRAEVEQALETLEKAISVVREYGFHSNQPSPSFNFTCEKDDKVYIYSRELGQLCSKKEVSTVKVLDKEILEENSQEALRNNPDIHSLRRTGTNSNLKEVNYNKVVPASPEPEQNVSLPICYSENGATEIPTLNQNTLDSGKQSDAVTIQDTSSDQPKKSSRLKKHQYCCFLPSSSGKLRWLRAEDKKIG